MNKKLFVVRNTFSIQGNTAENRITRTNLNLYVAWLYKTDIFNFKNTVKNKEIVYHFPD